MNYSPSSRDAIDEHCREVIRSCLNIVEQHGDTYVAIHKDDDIECIVLVSMIRSYPILHTGGCHARAQGGRQDPLQRRLCV